MREIRFYLTNAFSGLTLWKLMLLSALFAAFFLLSRKQIEDTTHASFSPAFEKQLKQFCTTCHRFPSPTVLPKSAWLREIEKMYALYQMHTPMPQPIPNKDEVLAYYVQNAPPEFSFESVEASTEGRFERLAMPLAPRLSEAPAAVACVAAFSEGDRLQILFADWRSDSLMRWYPGKDNAPEAVATIPALGRIRQSDFNLDGQADLLLSSLGQNLPTDHAVGHVMWWDAFSNRQPVSFVQGIRRVADARASDFDDDGDADLVVAVFGFYHHGEILYLDNMQAMSQLPGFEPYVLDGRAGAVSVHLTDLDNDNRTDVVALISQETESVVAYLNRGAPSFLKVPLFEADHPGWGCSGLEMADLDGDGDDDFLLINGDILDNEVVKPYHQIGWLENCGDLRFQYHLICAMPGVYAAKLGDLDGDGDVDIAASSWLPLHQPGSLELQEFASVVWIEQVEPGWFVRHVVEKGQCIHPAIELADHDGDGDLDIVAANFLAGVYYENRHSVPDAHEPLVIFENRGPSQ